MAVKPAEAYELSLAEVLSRFVDVLGAYVFGSRAEGRSGPASDLDIGVLLRGSPEPGRKLAQLEELARRWTRTIGFRNILVHNYLEIDRNIVFDVLQENLGDFEDLARAFSAYLTKQWASAATAGGPTTPWQATPTNLE